MRRYEFAERTRRHGLVGIGEMGDRANKGQVAGCMEQVLQKGLWQGKETEVVRGGEGTKLVLTRS